MQSFLFLSYYSFNRHHHFSFYILFIVKSIIFLIVCSQNTNMQIAARTMQTNTVSLARRLPYNYIRVAQLYERVAGQYSVGYIVSS